MNEPVEQQLRQGLRDLVADPVPAPPAAGAIRAGRAMRRRRRVAAALAGVVVAAVAGIAVAHRPAPPATVGAQASAGVSATPSTGPATDPVVHDSLGVGPEPGPDHATIGTPYPFDLKIHCGIRYADFTGRPWQADVVQPTYRPDRSDWRSQMYVRGTMTLVSPDEARFDAPVDGLHVTFRPLTGKRELCG